MKDFNTYKEFVFQREFNNLLEKRLIRSFQDRSYWNLRENKNTNLWNKLRKDGR